LKDKCYFRIMTVQSFSILLCFCLLLTVGCSQKKTISEVASPATNEYAKFEPADGQCLFFIGQDLTAVGGLDNYTEGYCDYFDMPTGVTVYTGFSKGGESYGYYFKGNDGIVNLANWGAGDCQAQQYIDDENFKHSLIAIGLSLVGSEKEIASGEGDGLIKDLGNWIKGLGQRPVFLRIGYEFDGWDWNNYQKKPYLASWQRIHDVFEELEVNNVALVWQSKGVGSNQEVLEEWYPGDNIVDWVGYSYFGNPDEEMLDFARRHNKPVFIAEAAPVNENDGLFFNTDLEDPEVAANTWRNWFEGFIATINDNQDVVKAFSYINADWPSEPMWLTNDLFKHVDSRLNVNEDIADKWKAEFYKQRYPAPSADLWDELGN